MLQHLRSLKCPLNPALAKTFHINTAPSRPTPCAGLPLTTATGKGKRRKGRKTDGKGRGEKRRKGRKRKQSKERDDRVKK